MEVTIKNIKNTLTSKRFLKKSRLFLEFIILLKEKIASTCKQMKKSNNQKEKKQLE